MAVNKTWNEKLNAKNDLPRVQFIEEDSSTARKQRSGRMLIAAPLQYDAIMKTIPYGKVITSEEIRDHLAHLHHADFTCQLTAGIFINIVANASRERARTGKDNLTPYWRTLKKDGELNEKYPDGVDAQRAMLEMEGHTIVQKGNRYFVKDYKERLHKLP